MDEQNGVCPYNGILFSLEKEIVTRATTQISFKGIMLNEISQSHTHKNLPWLVWLSELSASL